MRRWLWLSVVLALAMAYPLLFSTPFLQRLGALVLLYAIAAGVTGIAGALIATFFYIVPTVGETLGIVAFVTVSLGGFGSIPGALVAGLLIGVIESLSAYWIGAVYKDIVVYSLFLCFLWFRPQGLMGKL